MGNFITTNAALDARSTRVAAALDDVHTVKNAFKRFSEVQRILVKYDQLLLHDVQSKLQQRGAADKNILCGGMDDFTDRSADIAEVYRPYDVPAEQCDGQALTDMPGEEAEKLLKELQHVVKLAQKCATGDDIVCAAQRQIRWRWLPYRSITWLLLGGHIIEIVLLFAKFQQLLAVEGWQAMATAAAIVTLLTGLVTAWRQDSKQCCEVAVASIDSLDTDAQAASELEARLFESPVRRLWQLLAVMECKLRLAADKGAPIVAPYRQ